MWNTLGTLPNLLPDSSKSSSSTTKSAISNGTIEVRDANFNMQTLSRDTKDSLNKLDEIFDKKKIEERQELSKLFAKEAFGQLHNWNPTSKEGKVAKAIAHGVVAEVSARMAGNKPGSGFYAGATNEALIGEIQKIAKEKPDVAQSLSALLGAAVNGSLGYSPVTGAAEAQYGTKWNANQVEPNMKHILNDIESTGVYVNSQGEKIYISKLDMYPLYWTLSKGGIFMRYSYEFKKKAIELFYQGEWPETPNGVSPHSFHEQIRYWAKQEELHGPDINKLYGVKKDWSTEDKYELVCQVLAGESLRSVAIVAGINSGLLYQWVHKYKTLGYNGLINKPKGRRPKDSDMKVTKNISPRQLNESEYEELIRLRAENAYIKAENEVIKKEIALREEKEAARLKAKKQRLSKHSESKDIN